MKLMEKLLNWLERHYIIAVFLVISLYSLLASGIAMAVVYFTGSIMLGGIVGMIIVMAIVILGGMFCTMTRGV